MRRGDIATLLGRAERAWRAEDIPGVFQARLKHDIDNRDIDPRRVRRRLARCPEIDCVRHLLPPGTLAAAELRSAEIGIGADRVLIAAGVISEDEYAAALAHFLGVRFEPLEETRRTDCPLDDYLLMEAAAAGLLRLRPHGEAVLVIASQGLAVRHLIGFLMARENLTDRIRITTAERIEQFVARHCAAAIGRVAAHSLRMERPDFSAAMPSSRLIPIVLIALTIFGLLTVPRLLLMAIDIALALIFLGWTALRLVGALTTSLLWRRKTHVSDDRLPIYTVIVALHREAATAEELVKALAGLDYPKEKLDIKFVVEADDLETISAIENLRFHLPFQIIISPRTGPRTKPKALNAALQFARGAFVTVYDAEDRPEPGQLRLALQAFAADSNRLACVQARLTIDNSTDGWLTRLFTAEYAGLFDVFLPGIAAWRLPLPLGGSSNHFRTAVLREIGGWDPYNVTEDADLGMRLSRFGYRTAVINSTTYEEAPSRFWPWLKQRTRWFKGWMQTWLVHTRHPIRLLRDLGVPGFVVFQLVVGGTVLAALVHGLFAVALAWEIFWRLASGHDIIDHQHIADLIVVGLHGTTLVTGYVVSGLLGVIGLVRRRLMNCAWSLLLMPVYWMMLSIAAWRALIHLVRDPYRWEKTEHGLARTSRLAEKQAAARSSAADLKFLQRLLRVRLGTSNRKAALES